MNWACMQHWTHCSKCRQCTTAVHLQVKDINVSKESPCGHGIVTCFSIYGGKSGSGEVCNFAADPSGPPQDRLWVDTMLDDQVRRSTNGSCTTTLFCAEDKLF